MHRRCLAQVKQLGQALRVVAIVLVLGAKDQPQLTRMRHHDACRQRPQQVVEVALAATGLVADLEAIGKALEDAQHLLDAAYPRAVGHLPGLAQGADRNVLRVDVQTDVKHKAPLEIEERLNQAPLIPRYPIDRGFLHSFTPEPFGLCGPARFRSNVGRIDGLSAPPRRGRWSACCRSPSRSPTTTPTRSAAAPPPGSGPGRAGDYRRRAAATGRPLPARSKSLAGARLALQSVRLLMAGRPAHWFSGPQAGALPSAYNPRYPSNR